MIHGNNLIFYYLHFLISVIFLATFLKKIFDKKNDKVKFDLISQTNADYISVIFGCLRVIQFYQFLSIGLDE